MMTLSSLQLSFLFGNFFCLLVYYSFKHYFHPSILTSIHPSVFSPSIIDTLFLILFIFCFNIFQIDLTIANGNHHTCVCVCVHVIISKTYICIYMSCRTSGLKINKKNKKKQRHSSETCMLTTINYIFI